MYIELLTPDKIAVFILTFIAGLFIARVLKGSGIGGCVTYIFSLVVVVLIISALIKGYSYLFEQITYNLEYYIYYNAVGIAGAIIGLLLGLVIFGRK